MNIVDHFNTTLSEIECEDKKIEFLLRTAHIVNEYITAQAASTPSMQSTRPFAKHKWRNTAQVNQNRLADTTRAKYFEAVGIAPLRNAPMVNTNAPASTREHLENTKCCAAPNVIILIEDAVCTSCGRKVKDSTQYVSATNDGNANLNRVISFSDVDSEDVTVVDKTALVNRSLLRLQGVRVSIFKEHEWTRLYNNVTAGITDVSTMSCAMINRNLSGPDKKYAKDIYVIWEKITGRQINRLSDAMLWLINHKVANQIVIPTKANQKQPRILAMTLLYKCFKLCGEKELADLIVMQHPTANITSFEPIWRQTCQTHHFKYMN